MVDELTELLDTAIYKEIAAEATYTAAQKRTQDTGAKALMRELAGEEKKHEEDKSYHQTGVQNHLYNIAAKGRISGKSTN